MKNRVTNVAGEEVKIFQDLNREETNIKIEVVMCARVRVETGVVFTPSPAEQNPLSHLGLGG